MLTITARLFKDNQLIGYRLSDGQREQDFTKQQAWLYAKNKQILNVVATGTQEDPGLSGTNGFELKKLPEIKWQDQERESLKEYTYKLLSEDAYEVLEYTWLFLYKYGIKSSLCEIYSSEKCDKIKKCILLEINNDGFVANGKPYIETHMLNSELLRRIRVNDTSFLAITVDTVMHRNSVNDKHSYYLDYTIQIGMAKVNQENNKYIELSNRLLNEITKKINDEFDVYERNMAAARYRLVAIDKARAQLDDIISDCNALAKCILKNFGINTSNIKLPTVDKLYNELDAVEIKYKSMVSKLKNSLGAGKVKCLEESKKESTEQENKSLNNRTLKKYYKEKLDENKLALPRKKKIYELFIRK